MDKERAHRKNKAPRGRKRYRTKINAGEEASMEVPPIEVQAELIENAETLEDIDDSVSCRVVPKSTLRVQSNTSPKNSSDDESSRCSVGSVRSASPGRMPAPPKLCFGLALFLWLSEIITVLALKRCGMLHNDFSFDQAVKDQLAPHLERIQIQLEQSLQLSQYVDQVVAQFNESSILPPLAYFLQEKKRPGYQLATMEGAQAYYPVVMVPGFVTSGLEVWGGKPCARKHFRQRLWAAVGGARSFFTDRDCWRQHMMLDPLTGSDPDGIRLRSAQGFEAADFFMANYWVWGKLIQNLADVGYTPSLMAMEAYDWRLAYPILEERDGYFSRLKSRIEDIHRLAGRKVVLTSHSMGALVTHYFFAWVTTSRQDGGGGGGKKWVDEHIHNYVNIAGSHLGVPKATTALLSGEMSDTVLLGTFGNVVEQFFGRRLRRDLWHTWGSLFTMLPKGGNAMWSTGADMCSEWSVDDPLCPPSGRSPMITMTDEWPKNVVFSDNWTEAMIHGTLLPFLVRPYHDNEDIIAFLTSFGGGYGQNVSSAKLMTFFGDNKISSKTWHDPTVTPLPYAPNMKIHCLYGIGLDTERAYYYRRSRIEAVVDRMDSGGNCTDPVLKLDASMENETQNVRHGVRYTNGDGSVPLISLGYMCADAWTRKDSGLNPSMTPVFTREYEHHPEFSVDDPMRAGPHSADHVDILGNDDMVEDFLRIVTNTFVEKVDKDQITSDIKEVSEKINAHPLGGIFQKNWGLLDWIK
jgi:phospholipid:diacylglycerol acyltransferase